jgi:hypothetical protein
MKKVLTLLLAVVCLFSLFSCGSKDMNTISQEFALAEGVYASAKITMTVAVDEETEETQEIVASSDLYMEADPDEGKVNYMVVQCFVPLGFDDFGNAIIPDSDTIELSAAKGTERINFSSLEFKTKYFSEYSLTENRFKATVDQPKAFFGVELSTDEVQFDAQRGPYGPRKITISYETTEGYQIDITISYKYED